MIPILFGLAALSCDAAPPDSSETPLPSPDQALSEPYFREVSLPTGLDFIHDPGQHSPYYMPQIIGSGGALFDYDGDGDLDIYLVSAAGENQLYRRDEGRFVNVTREAGLTDREYGMGCAVGDIDNDGDLDLFVTNLGHDRLFLNEGTPSISQDSEKLSLAAGNFREVSEKAGIREDTWSTSATFLDFDRDGFLDLYVATYLNYDPSRSCTDISGQPEYCGPKSFPATPDILYRNIGDGSFRDVSRASGIGLVAGKALGVLVEDYNSDGWPDLCVANDGEENFLWMNQGNGRFENEALLRGAALNLFGQAEASMGVAAGDIDGDGLPDLFMTHLDRETNTLYRNLGNGQFEDQTSATGLGSPSLPFTGFGTLFLDFDLDGYLDLFVANGKVRRGGPAPKAENIWTEYAQTNQLFENDGRGRFSDLSDQTAGLTVTPQVSRGAMAGDFDGDGDLDILVTNSNGPARLYENRMPRKGHWLTVRAIDPVLRTDAIGAILWLKTSSGTQRRMITSNYSYLSAGPPWAYFGTGAASEVVEMEVLWPDGNREVFQIDGIDRLVELRKGSGTK